MGSDELIIIAFASVIWIAGFFHTGRFVRPKWKIPGKFFFFVGMSYLLFLWMGYWCLTIMIAHQLLGLVFHIKVCRENEINWISCQPKEKYLALQEKWARGDFSKELKSY